MPWPLVQHPHALPDREPDARPVLGRPLEDAARLVEAATGVEHEFEPQSVTAPFLDFVVLHRALPDLQRMKLLLFCCRVVGTEVGILFGAIKPDL